MDIFDLFKRPKSSEVGVRPEFQGVGITTETPAGSLNGAPNKDRERRDGAARGLALLALKRPISRITSISGPRSLTLGTGTHEDYIREKERLVPRPKR